MNQCTLCSKKLGENINCIKCRNYIASPTSYLPGSEEKLFILRQRVKFDVPLFVKGDDVSEMAQAATRKWVDDNQICRVERLYSASGKGTDTVRAVGRYAWRSKHTKEKPQRIYLGVFDSAEEASRAVKEDRDQRILEDMPIRRKKKQQRLYGLWWCYPEAMKFWQDLAKRQSMVRKKKPVLRKRPRRFSRSGVGGLCLLDAINDSQQFASVGITEFAPDPQQVLVCG